MPQAVIIQTESVFATSSKHAPSAKANTDAEAFSAQLDKHVKQSDISRPQAGRGQAANTAEADKDIAADGNNLPTEATGQNEQTETAVKESNAAEEGETGSADTVTVEMSAAEAVSGEADTTDTEAVTTAAVNSETESDSKANTFDKPIRAQVTVSQQAVDHAKAAPVEMTAKTHPKQTVENNAVNETAGKAATGTDKTVAATVNTETVTLPVSNKTAVETVSNDKPTTPNLAAVLKQGAEQDSKAPKIRADILEALQRQQNKQDTGINLRNLIANQVAAKSDMAPVMQPSALTASALVDSAATPVTTLAVGSALTASGQAAAQGNALSPAVLSLPIQPGMQNPAWSQVMSSRVIWMAKEGLQQAQLRMNPANLGPVEVKLHVQNDQASVTFLAQHSATRDALEQALPRLRESFAENGMELTNAQVGEQEQHHREQSEQANESLFVTQAISQEDDIESEAVETAGSEQTSGLSLYA